MTERIKPEHDCGMCDGPLRFLTEDDGVPTWECERCKWWHTSTDCCHGF